MNEIFANVVTEITPMINSIIILIVGGVFTWIGAQVKRVLNKVEATEEMKRIKQELENNKEIVKISVDYVEKIGQHLTGPEKKELALKKITQIANDKGSSISQDEVEAMLEQLVGNFKDGFRGEAVLLPEDSEIEVSVQNEEEDKSEEVEQKI